MKASSNTPEKRKTLIKTDDSSTQKNCHSTTAFLPFFASHLNPIKKKVQPM